MAAKHTVWKTVCVDFDGVIHQYTSGWKGAHIVADGPVPGAIRWLEEASLKFNVAIFSARSSRPEGLSAMKAAIHTWARGALGIYGAKQLMSRIRFPEKKPAAVLYVDDRAFLFQGRFPTAEFIDQFQPWNK